MFGRRIFWLDCAGQPLGGHALASAILRRTAEDALPIVDFDDSGLDDKLDLLCTVISKVTRSDKTVVVIDNLALDNPSSAQQVSTVAAALQASGSHLVVTTRSPSSLAQLAFPDAGHIGVPELCLSEEEAVLIARGIATSEPSTAWVSEALRASGGHVALFEVLVRSPSPSGHQPTSLAALLNRLVLRDTDESSRRDLLAAVLLKHGSLAEWRDVAGHACHEADLRASLGDFPLMRIQSESAGNTTFVTHDLLDDFVVTSVLAGRMEVNEDVARRAIDRLDQRGDFIRSATVLCRIGTPEQRIGWMKHRGDWLLRRSMHQVLRSLVEGTPMSALMSEPSVMLLWAELEKDAGQVEDALVRAQAAQALARHSGDKRTEQLAWARRVYYLVLLNRPLEADRLAGRLVEACGQSLSEALRGEVHFARGTAAVVVGDLDDAAAHFRNTLELAQKGDDVSLSERCLTRIAVLDALRTGSFSAAAMTLAPVLDDSESLLSERLTTRGNLGVCFLETGRLGRAAALMREFEGEQVRHLSGAFLPMLGCALVGLGSTVEGLTAFQRGVELSVECRDEMSLAANRVYQAALLRAMGMTDSALVAAERAYERLLLQDYMGMRLAAEVEIVACLLSAGDTSRAMARLRQIRVDGTAANPRTGLSIQMVSATLALRSGDPEAAAATLAPFRDYILSGNANWQSAMYIRAFPELLGAFVLAIGPDELPVHMLRMVLPEHAERSLLATRGFLAEEMWRDLGVRLLGQDEFAEFLHRDGRPLCRVRLFGGLEVSVGARAIRERDWKKRKARLLFAMLVTRHGNDVPRDQIFDYLWPDMDEERAKNNLYVAWSTMKSALMGDEPGRCPYIENVGGVCKVVSENLRSDVDEFEAALAAVRAAEKSGDTAAELAAYRRISDAYRGDLLPGDVYDDWFAQLREQFRSDFCQAMLRAAELLCDAEKPADGLAYVRRAIQTDPLREDLYQIALRCQIAAGQRGAAIDLYQQCKTRLADDLGLDPSAETRALYDRILAMEDAPITYGFDLLDD
jgi:DNA-binding SARP family transcriptional activator